jgi:hypothetical protein
MPPLPKTCPKTVCPRKGVAFLWKAFLQKKFRTANSIQNGSSRLLISQRFLPRSVPNRHLRDTLGSKGFFRTSVPTVSPLPLADARRMRPSTLGGAKYIRCTRTIVRCNAPSPSSGRFAIALRRLRGTPDVRLAARDVRRRAAHTSAPRSTQSGAARRQARVGQIPSSPDWRQAAGNSVPARKQQEHPRRIKSVQEAPRRPWDYCAVGSGESRSRQFPQVGTFREKSEVRWGATSPQVQFDATQLRS